MEEYSRWTLSERQRLLKALEKYSPQQSSEIAKMVSTKSEADVIYYLSKLKRSLKFNAVAAGTSLQRKYLKNIETWIRFTHRLVDDEEETYTTMIGKLLALYGEYCFKKTDLTTGVNFKSIYDYLAALMLGVQLPVLAPLEAALILDLLKNVASFLSQSDITLHKKFVLFNYKKCMYPNLASSGENEQSILKKLLHEALPPPCSTPSSSSSSSQPVEMIPTNFQREYEENILSDGTKATVVHLRRINTPSKQTKSDTNIQELDFSKSSLRSEKIPAACMNETPKNSSETKQPTSNMSASASAEIKRANTINHKGNKTFKLQNVVLQEISSTSKTLQSGMISLLTVKRKSVPNSNSAMQGDPKVVHVQQDARVLPLKQIKSHLKSQQVSSGTCVTSNDVKQKFSVTIVQKGQNNAGEPKENNVPQVVKETGLSIISNRESGQQSQDCTSVSQVSNGDNVQQVSNNSSTDQVPSQTKVLLLSNANTLLPFPSGGTVLQVPSGDTVLHLPKIGTVTKGQDSTSVSQLSCESTIQQGPDSSSLSDEPNDCSVSQDPSRDTIQKRSILLQDPSGHCVQQQIGHTNALQRMNNTFVSQDPNGGTVQQGASNIKVFQVTKKRLVEKGSRDASQLKEPRGDIIQKDVSNVKVIQPSRLAKQLSSGATAPRGLSVKIVQQVPSVSAETQTSKSVKRNQKRKFSKVESEKALRPNERHCQQLKYETHDSESIDSKSKADKHIYKPSVSWLNPMNIPSRLINLTKTKQKIISK